MNEKQKHPWHIEFAQMRAGLRFALENLDSISLRGDVQDMLEAVYARLNELTEQTQGESK